MALNNQAYWNKRAEEREKEWTSQSKKKLEKQVRKIYLKALKDIQEKLNALYGKYADENDLTLQEAKKMISDDDYTVWRMDIEEYVKKAETDSEILKELNTLAMRSRISRLDKLQSEILMALQKMGIEYDNTLETYLGDALKNSYYHTTFDIAKGIDILFPVAELKKKTIKNILREPWSGKQFSKRIWSNTNKLAKVLKKEIATSMIRGVNAQEMSSNIAKKMDSSYKQALNLVRTELNYVSNQGSLKAIKDTGGKEYRYVATLDSRTSQICRKLDGTIHKVKEGSPGTNMPPMHPRCRSTITVTDATANAISKRISKVNGKTEYVPANMKYSDWEEIYVKKTMTLQKWKNSSENDKITTSKHKVVEGTDVTQVWKQRKIQFKYPIEDIINYQGFDGLPKIVKSKEVFNQLIQDDHFIAKRVVTAKTKEELTSYVNQLRTGKWYVECQGGAQYGMGMYCAADYTKGLLSKGLNEEMENYINVGRAKQKPFYHIETLTLDKSAKILTVPNMKSVTYLDILMEIAKQYVKRHPKEYNLKENYTEEEYKKAYISCGNYIFKKRIDAGFMATALGYDAINAVGHGKSKSYTVVLNRTKLIILEE